jgi:sugar lactone lactonase YvrE
MARRVRTIVEGLSFAEGPRWRDGALYLADMHANRVLRVGSHGGYEVVAQLEGPVSGIGWLPDGRLLVVSMNDRRLMRQEADGRMVVHADLSGVAHWHANDLAVASDGTAYVGNFGFSLHPPGDFRSTALARVAPDGAVTAAADELWFPNGIAISEDGRTLIVAESGAFCLTAFDIAPDGALTNRRVWAQLDAGQSPDGICLDAEGAARVALPVQKAFIRVREGGEVIETLPSDQIALACVLGGPDRRTLYVMSAGHTDPKDRIADLTGAVSATKVEVAGVGFP